MWANFNVSTGGMGAVGAGAAAGTYGILPIGNGIYFIWLKASCLSSNAAGRLLISPLDSDRGSRVPTFTGDGTSGVFVWGFQFEVGNYPTSYIPTTNAAVTRAQDVCINGSGNVVNFASWYNTTANSALVSHHARYAAGTSLPNASVFCMNDNSASNRSMLFRNFNGAATGKMVVTSGGVDSFAQNISAAAAATTYKHAVAIAANDYALYEGGVQLGVDASGALPVSPVQMSVGHCVVAGSPIDYLNGSVGELRIYPARISNSELARLST